jgi:hypothetical protein
VEEIPKNRLGKIKLKKNRRNEGNKNEQNSKQRRGENKNLLTCGSSHRRKLTEEEEKCY